MSSLSGAMNFVIGANIPASRTTGMGRQMYGVGDALNRCGHAVAYLFRDSIPCRTSDRFSRLEFPLRAATRVRRMSAEGPVLALLHEPTAWASAVLVRGGGVRVLAMVHNCELKVWRETLHHAARMGQKVPLSSRLLWPATELWQAWLSLKTADVVFCLSSEDREYIERAVGISSERVVRIDNGVEPAFLNAKTADERERDVLFLASWLPHKGTRFFTEALEKLAGRGLFPTVTIAGTGAPERAVRGMLPPPFRDSAIVMERVQPEELVALYQRHRVFVLPSVYEGIPLSLLEAMACGLHPIATRVGGIPDVVEDGVDGTLVEPMDAEALFQALVPALTDAKLTARRGAAAREKLQGYAWDRAAAQIESAVIERRLDS